MDKRWLFEQGGISNVKELKGGRVKITRYEYGDIAADAAEPMTVRDLIDALKQMPGEATVYRYCDWTVKTVLFEHHEDGQGKVELH